MTLSFFRKQTHDFFFSKIFLMWTIFKVFIEFVTVVLLFMFWFYGLKACGILAA